MNEEGRTLSPDQEDLRNRIWHVIWDALENAAEDQTMVSVGGLTDAVMGLIAPARGSS